MLWANSVREMRFGCLSSHTVDMGCSIWQMEKNIKRTNTESNSFRDQELALCPFTDTQNMVLVAQKVPECFRVTLTSLNYWSILYFKTSSWVRCKKLQFFSLLYWETWKKKNVCNIFSRLNMKYFIQWNIKGNHFLFLFIWAWFKKGRMWLHFCIGWSRISG